MEGSEWGLSRVREVKNYKKWPGKVFHEKCSSVSKLREVRDTGKLVSCPPTEIGIQGPSLQVLAGTNKKLFWQP